jgi:glutamine cyclotransferase
MRIAIAISAFVLLTLPVLTAPAPAHAATVTVTVTKKECRHVVAHTPHASVAYTPGVTAGGRAVAPTNLGGSGNSVKPPTEFSIDINIDLQQRFGLPANKGQ